MLCQSSDNVCCGAQLTLFAASGRHIRHVCCATRGSLLTVCYSKFGCYCLKGNAPIRRQGIIIILGSAIHIIMYVYAYIYILCMYICMCIFFLLYVHTHMCVYNQVYIRIHRRTYLSARNQARIVLGKPPPSCAGARNGYFWYFSESEPDYALKVMLMCQILP